MAILAQAYFYEMLPSSLRGLGDVRMLGARDTSNWEIPLKGVPREFGDKLRDFYIACAENSEIRQLTKTWIQIMKETSP